MIEINVEALSREAALTKEWLETDGRGGYASSSLHQCHTRKYHGLLVSRLPRLGGRYVLLSKLEDSVLAGDNETFFSMHQYPGMVFPESTVPLTSFFQDVCPRFVYECEGFRIEKELLLVRGHDAVLVRYRFVRGEESLLLRIRPLLAYRGIHELARENTFIRSEVAVGERGFSIAPYEAMPRLHVCADSAVLFAPGSWWYRDFEYSCERDRGFPFREDLFMPGMLEMSLDPGMSRTLAFSLMDQDNPERLWAGEIRRRKRRRSLLKRSVPEGSLLENCLRDSADSFIIRDERGTSSVIAGYHWFYVWGRDTLISLPGLTFCRGRIREGVAVLKAMAARRRGGLLPNCLSDSDGEDAYNSVDASLWFFWCLQELLRVSGDIGLIRRAFWSVMKDIAGRYLESRGGPVVHLESGLIAVGDRTTQLTWMDAAVDGDPVTPRGGCPVEINALWFNALSFMHDIARSTGLDPGFDVAAERDELGRTFNDLFWIPGKNYLADLWDSHDGRRDESVRPNQLFAVSLPSSPLDGTDRSRHVVQRVTDELLTPWGLRSLSPHDPNYRGRYEGDAASRDAAYHQGTVWPWLLGHYGDALMKTERTSDARKKLLSLLKQFERHLLDAGIGSVSEVFDGDEPWRPSGCIAQAWSVAELYRLSDLVRRPDQG